MKITNWGIIGPGKIARDFASDLRLLDSPNHITAILGQSSESTEQFAKDFGISNFYTNQKEFFHHQFDAIYIASPHTSHFQHSLSSLQQRIPVLCEKPMAINADLCRQLIDCSKKNKTFLMEAMWIRFLPSIQQLLAMVNENWIGKILSIKASMGYKAPNDRDNRFFDPKLGGGSLLDLGIYPVFLTTLLMGRPQTIKAVGKLSPDGIDETCSILFQYRDGQHAVLESSLVSDTDMPAEIVGEKGTLRLLDPWYEKSKGIELSLYGEGKIIYPCTWYGHGLQYEISEVISCIRMGQTESKLLPHNFSLTLIEIMDEIRNQIKVVYESYEHHRH